MRHTINDQWEFMLTELHDGLGTKSVYGVRWADGHELLFKDMPEQQAIAYLKRAGVKDPAGHLKNKANN